MRVMVGHPTGNQFFRHLSATLADERSLAWTGTCLTEASVPESIRKMLPASFRRELGRRRFDHVGDHPVHAHPSVELLRLIGQRVPIRRLRNWAGRHVSVDSVYRNFDRWMASQIDAHAPTHLYAYEDAALHVFEAAAARSICRVYDLPIAHWKTLRSLIHAEAERCPEWAETLAGGLTDPPEKLERKCRELELADVVVVPSRFVADSLPPGSARHVCLAPFGSPPPVDDHTFDEMLHNRRQRARQGRPLRVLFAGSMSQRKGLADLMSAMTTFSRDRVELVVLGSPQADQAFYDRQCPGFRWESTRPHAEVLELMRSCDLFCLPSIVEGRALVIQEAMSQGLPVIVTPNTGADDLVTFDADASPESGLETADQTRYGRGTTGFVVPIARADCIAEAIDWCLGHRDDLLAMAEAARIASASYTWHAYAMKIVAAMRSMVLDGAVVDESSLPAGVPNK